MNKLIMTLAVLVMSATGCSLINTTAQFRGSDGGTCGAGDASCACTIGTTRACPMGNSTGVCQAGSQACMAPGVWGACVGSVGPATELCDGLDNDCNGTPDDGQAATSCGTPMRGTGACTLGACAVASCTSGFGDCNTMFSDGCESTLGTAAHCASCSDVCAWACEPAGCDDAMRVEAGGAHTCALRSSGTVYCWGQNSSGQLGDGTMTDSVRPVHVVGLTGRVTDLSVGFDHACAVIAGGTVVCWGNNTYGGLGDGTNMARSTPVIVQNFSGVATQVVAAHDFSCAVSTTGAVQCWGQNRSGQLGNGNTNNYNVAQPVSGLMGIATQVDAWQDHTCAIVSGTARCWGFNASGQLGDGGTTSRSTPGIVVGLTDVAEVAVGYTDTCARMTSGTVACWGSNDVGQLGDGTMTGHNAPALVSGLSDARQITGGRGAYCVRRADASVACWGGNGSGELGDGTLVVRSTPVAVVGLGGPATGISTFDGSTCATIGTGLPQCWGGNGAGQLGDGTIMRRTMPVSVLPP